MKKNGLTLIEILVVITILSVLFSMLLPAYKAARERARRIVCLNNVKEMCLAVEMYKQDFDGWYPTCGWDFTQDDFNDWGGDWGAGNFPNLGVPWGQCWLDAIAPYLKGEEKIFICPSDPAPDDFEWYCWGGKTAFSRCSYGANEDIVGIDNWGNFGSGAQGRLGGKAKEVRNPSRVILIIDADHIWVNSQGDNLTGRALYHHYNGFNAVFCDGHARWIPEWEIDDVTLDPGGLW